MTTYKCNGNRDYTVEDDNSAVILGYPHHAKVIYVTGSIITKDGKDCAYWLDSLDESDIAEKGYSFGDFHDARFCEDKSEQFLCRRLSPSMEIRIGASLDNDGVVGEIRHSHRGEVIAQTGVCESVWSAIIDIERKLEELVQSRAEFARQGGKAKSAAKAAAARENGKKGGRPKKAK